MSMQDVTPDMISSAARRLFSELPGDQAPPPVEIPADAPMTAGVVLPASYADVPGAAAALHSAHGHANSGGQMPLGGNSTSDSPPLSLSQAAAGLTSAQNAMGGAANSPISTHSPVNLGIPGGAKQPDGIRAFVSRIQATGLSADSQCLLGDPGLNALGRAIAGKSFRGGTLPGESSRPLDVPTIRQDFPILRQLVHGRPLAWLDNAATTQKPQAVIDAISRFYAQDNSNIHRAAQTLAARATGAYEDARAKVQRFIGAGSPEEIIFVRGTTEGINLVAQTYGKKFLQPGDEIVLSTLEHHANIVPWQMIAKERGAVIRVIPVTDRGEIMLEEYQAILGPRTRLVAITHASNSLGTILPIGEMTHLAKRYGAQVLIDGAQSVAHIPVNVYDLGIDFFVFSGHKIFGPTGIGAVYAKYELQELMPPWQGGGNMIRNVTFEETTYSPPPGKFEAGTPNIADAVGLGAALDYVRRIGLPNIGKYEQQLLKYATERLSRINGLRLIGTAREKVAVLSFVLQNRRTEEIGKLLDLEGIAVRAGHHCAQPSLRRNGVEATVRPSLSFYNTFDEVDRLADAVERIARIG